MAGQRIMTVGKMIFHAPFVLGEHRAQSASGIRPQKMAQAFQEAGYEVTYVTGSVKERKKAIRKLKQQIKAGAQYDFLYSESTTQPHIFTGRHRWPLNPFFDYAFFRFCRRNGIQVGLFYRDVYWRFPEYVKDVGILKASLIIPFYFWDLFNYRFALDRLFLPSTGYGEYLPIIDTKKFALLPPGGEIIDSDFQETGNLLYVGGLGNHYKIHAAFDAVKASSEAQLTVCTREAEWQQVGATYPESPNIRVVHRSGDGLAELYDDAQYALMFMETTKYRSFAVPFKLFEYLGRGKPVIASEGTYAGDIVTELGIGWSIPYDSDTLSALLDRLREHPEEYRRMVHRARQVRHEHTWLSRVEQVRRQLTGTTTGL